jgi:hypothetical protein
MPVENSLERIAVEQVVEVYPLNDQRIDIDDFLDQSADRDDDDADNSKTDNIRNTGRYSKVMFLTSERDKSDAISRRNAKNKEPSLRSSITSNTGSINNKNTNNNIFGAPFGLSEAKFEEIAP